MEDFFFFNLCDDRMLKFWSSVNEASFEKPWEWCVNVTGSYKNAAADLEQNRKEEKKEKKSQLLLLKESSSWIEFHQTHDWLYLDRDHQANPWPQAAHDDVIGDLGLAASAHSVAVVPAAECQPDLASHSECWLHQQCFLPSHQAHSLSF